MLLRSDIFVGENKCNIILELLTLHTMEISPTPSMTPLILQYISTIFGSRYISNEQTRFVGWLLGVIEVIPKFDCPLEDSELL